MSRQPILVLEGVVVERSSFTLGPISLTVHPGEAVCVVGPNGAGKTTLIDVVTGALAPRSGEVRIEGQRVDLRQRSFLSHVGVVPDDPGVLIEELTALEYWSLVARVHRGEHCWRETMDTTGELSRALGFEPPDYTIASFSHGMRKKVQLVASLLHDPTLLVIDELRNGLDPIAGRQAETVVQRALDRGKGALLASHDLYWTERNATSVVVLSGGQVVAKGPPALLRQPHDSSLEDAFLRLVRAAS